MIEFRNSDQMKSFMKKEAKRLNMNIASVYSTFVSRTFLEKLTDNNNRSVRKLKISSFKIINTTN